ncbi:MAG: hypothetical protein WC370_05670 [Dehalococcoidales bacterium]|jgi:hypothetical protein
MINDELIQRIQCIYTALGSSIETDIKKLKPKVIQDSNKTVILQDFSGGRKDSEIRNIANILIFNVANLGSHLKKWSNENDKDKSKVDATFKNSKSIRIIKDLSNNERHGYDPTKKGNSGLAPRLNGISSIMQMTTKPTKGSFVAYTFNRQGEQKILGNGSYKVIITGEILDCSGNKIGDLYDTLLEAIKDWEKLLSGFGVDMTLPHS